MRAWLGLILAVAGCAELPADGALECNPNPDRACPSGFECIAERCYRDGHGPDLGVAIGGDMTLVGNDDGGGSGGGGGTTDMAQVCGVTGAACCAAPLAPCSNPGTSCSATAGNTCIATDAWISGSASTSLLGPAMVMLWHYNNGIYTSIPSSIGMSDTHGNGIWGYQPNTYFTVDENGEIFQWDGSSWLTCSNGPCFGSGVTSNLSSVFGVSSSEIWIGGTASVMRHYESAHWVSRVTGLPGTFDVQHITGTAPDDIWFTGFAGTGHWTGSAWTFDNTIQGRYIWSNARNDVWAVGDNFIKHYDGTAWSPSYGVDGGSLPGTAWVIGGSSSKDIWTSYTKPTDMGNVYAIAHFDGTSWTSVPSPISPNYFPSAIWVASSTQAWLVTSFQLFELKNGAWSLVTLPVPSGYFAGALGSVWGSANAGH